MFKALLLAMAVMAAPSTTRAEGPKWTLLRSAPWAMGDFYADLETMEFRDDNMRLVWFLTNLYQPWRGDHSLVSLREVDCNEGRIGRSRSLVTIGYAGPLGTGAVTGATLQALSEREFAGAPQSGQASDKTFLALCAHEAGKPVPEEISRAAGD